MKKKANSPTRSKSAHHNGRAANDTNKLNPYRVTIRYKQIGNRYIEAKSSEEVREKTKLIPAMKGFWQDWPETFDVIEIETVDRDELSKEATILEIPNQN